MERAERRERGYSSQLRNKFWPYEQVSYAITLDELTVATLQWNVNMAATMLQRKQCPAASQTIYVREPTHKAIVKLGRV